MNERRDDPIDEGTRERAEAAVRAGGLAPRGVVVFGAADEVPGFDDGRPARSALLVGWRGREGWAAFATSPERTDGLPHPLDRWSERLIGGIADDLGAAAVFPHRGPPWWPFQRWAMRAEGLSPSPTGMLIDTTLGLWHAFRGALLFDRVIGREAAPQTSPCETCRTRSCLVACPADAFTGETYDVGRCRGFLESHAGGLCRTDGCRARDACPVGRAHRYAPDQIRFLMSAFRASLPETFS